MTLEQSRQMIFQDRQRLDYLRKRYPNLTVTDLTDAGEYNVWFIQIPDLKMPGFSKPEFAIGFKIPNGFPMANSAYFYFEHGLRRNHGGSIHKVGGRSPDVIAGKQWDISFASMNGWSPNDDTVYTYAMFVKSCVQWLGKH